MSIHFCAWTLIILNCFKVWLQDWRNLSYIIGINKKIQMQIFRYVWFSIIDLICQGFMLFSVKVHRKVSMRALLAVVFPSQFFNVHRFTPCHLQYMWLISFMIHVCVYLNTLRPIRNEQHFTDDIFKRIFFNENVWISLKISLKFVPKGPIINIPALVQIMAWRCSGVKPLSEPMMVSLPTHICVTPPQWVKF